MTKRVLVQRRSAASASFFHVVLRKSAEVEVKVIMRESIKQSIFPIFIINKTARNELLICQHFLQLLPPKRAPLANALVST
ncbi:hypothetical protein TNCV_3170391 [Trichonephila clavipes]|nr:hypothetical protein TNCV_3170391 [Trichonephila clavipes]